MTRESRLIGRRVKWNGSNEQDGVGTIVATKMLRYGLGRRLHFQVRFAAYTSNFFPYHRFSLLP